MQATQWLEVTEAKLEEITNTDSHVIETCGENDGWWQGDLGIQFLGHGRPNMSLAELKAAPTQLAEGNTKGSRHVLNALGVTAYKLADPHELVGYVLHCPHGLTVTHPEHGDVTVKEAGWYGIRYQRQHAEELRRAAD